MNLLNLEDEKFKDVKVRGYDFRIRYISPLDWVNISRHRVLLQNGSPIDCLTQGEYDFFQNVSIVNICTDSFPKEFKANESCINWPDQELINELASAIKEHTNDIEAKLKKNRPVDGGK